MILKLTTHLMSTYNAINEKYYAAKRLRQQQEREAAEKSAKLRQQREAGGIFNDGHDDKDYNYIIQPHELLAGRYVVDHSIGKGSFGRVVKAFDTIGNRYVAVKIVKSKSAFYKQAQVELKILLSLQSDADKWNVVSVLDHFMHKNHVCIIEGSMVTLADGRAVPIETVEPGMTVLSYQRGSKDGAADAAVPRRVTKRLDQGVKECVELQFLDGSALTCTPDHMLLTRDGRWIRADSLPLWDCLDTTQAASCSVAASVEYPAYPPEEDALRCATWTLDLSTSLGYALDLTANRSRTLAFMRLLGWSLTDSSNHSTPDRVELHLRHQLDVAAVRNDVFLLTGEMPLERTQSCVALPVSLSRALAAASSSEHGGRTHFPSFLFARHESEIPAADPIDWLCPLPAARAFLSGLFGGEGRTMTPQGPISSWRGVGWSCARAATLSPAQLTVLREDFAALLKRVAVDVHWETSQDAELSLDATLQFARSVGFAYSADKQMQLTLACTALRSVHHTTQQQRPVAPDSIWDAIGAAPRAAKPAAAGDSSEGSSFTCGLPLFGVPLLHRRPVGPKHVYDLSIDASCYDSASFLANNKIVHNCLVFELLSLNLYELLRNTRFQGVSLKLIAKFGQQLLCTLGYLNSKERGDKRVIHCDLKPENVLLRSSKKSAIKVIDFGSACFANQKAYTYIQSRFYRAPEVLLGLNYNGAIDMWSLGCILVEMHTGRPLFDGQNEADQMVKQVEILGVPPRHMLEKNRKAEKFFEISRHSNPGQYRLKLHLLPHARLGGSIRKALEGRWDPNSPLYPLFEDLISKMLTYDPMERIRPMAALQHGFFAAVAESIRVGTDAAVATSAEGANLTSASGNPAGSGSGVATGLAVNNGAAAAAAAAGASTAAAPAEAPKLDSAAQHHLLLMQQQHQLQHLHQQHRFGLAQQAAALAGGGLLSGGSGHNPRKRPHSNPLMGAGALMGSAYSQVLPLDPRVQEAIAAQSKKQTKKHAAKEQEQAETAAEKPLQNNLMQDAASAANAAIAASSSDATAAPAGVLLSSGAASSAMEDALQPDQTSTVIAAGNAQPQQAAATPSRAHGMVTRSSARSAGGDSVPSTGTTLTKQDSLDITGLRVAPLSAASSANNSRRSSPAPTDRDSHAAQPVGAVAAAGDLSRSRGSSQVGNLAPSGDLLVASTATTAAAASTASSPKHHPVSSAQAAPFSSAPSESGSSATVPAGASAAMIDVDQPARSDAEDEATESQAPPAAAAASSTQSTPAKKGGGGGGGGSSGKRGKRGKKHAAAAAAAAAAQQSESESEGGAGGSSSRLSRMSLDLPDKESASVGVGHRTRSHAANQ